MKCNPEKAINYSTSWSKVKDIYDQYREFRAYHKKANISNITLHIGTNQLSSDDTNYVAKKVCKQLRHLQQEFSYATNYYSTILPTYGKNYFTDGINHANVIVFHVLAIIECNLLVTVILQ